MENADIIKDALRQVLPQTVNSHKQIQKNKSFILLCFSKMKVAFNVYDIMHRNKSSQFVNTPHLYQVDFCQILSLNLVHVIPEGEAMVAVIQTIFSSTCLL